MGKKTKQYKPMIISDGMPGAGLAALRVAKALNLPTYGIAPPGFQYPDGPKPELAELYHLEELNTRNVKDKKQLQTMRIKENLNQCSVALIIEDHWEQMASYATYAEEYVPVFKTQCKHLYARNFISFLEDKPPYITIIGTHNPKIEDDMYNTLFEALKFMKNNN